MGVCLEQLVKRGRNDRVYIIVWGANIVFLFLYFSINFWCAIDDW